MNALRNKTVNRLATQCVECGQRLLTQLKRTKDSLEAEFRRTVQAQDKLVHLALNEAEALAWETDYPHLFFPTLAVEKVQALSTWADRQRKIRGHDSEISLAA
jgi:hypothetical protein